MDVIELIGKVPDKKIKENGPKLHEYIKEMNKKTFGNKNLLTVGEAWCAGINEAEKYSNPDGSELSMIFQFEHICLDQQEGKEKWDVKPLNLLDLKRVLSKWQTELDGRGWNSLFWNNHDLPRIVSRWGNDKKYRKESAKMLATILHGMKGTPYIYQGEELGMTNVKFDDIKDYKDIETLNMYDERLKKGYKKSEIMESIYKKGRDNARTPMQWNKNENAGFSKGTPWIKVNRNYKEINAEEEIKDHNSVFNYYKKLISIRKKNDVIVYGKYIELAKDDENIFAYLRVLNDEKILVVCNFRENENEFSLDHNIQYNRKELLISNYDIKENNINNIKLRPYEAKMYKLD